MKYFFAVGVVISINDTRAMSSTTMSATNAEMPEIIEMSHVNISDVAFRGLEKTLREHTKSIIVALADIYGFDADDAMSRLSFDIKLTKKAPFHHKKKSTTDDDHHDPVKKTKKDKVVRNVPSILLPWCGVVMDDWCLGIRSNLGLYTQCSNERDEGSELCKTCQKVASKSSNGELKYGLITSRNSFAHKVTSYDIVMKKKNITKEAAIEEAEKFGWVIPDEVFEASAVKRGRPKKDDTSSDASDKSKSPGKRGRGRPAKTKPLASASAVDDLLTSMINGVDKDADSSSNAGGSVSPKKRVLSDEQKAKMAAGRARKAAEKAEQKRLEVAAEAEAIRKNAMEAEKAQELIATETYELSSEEVSSVQNEDDERIPSEEENEDDERMPSDEEEENEDDDGKEVETIVIDGKTYYVDDENSVYIETDNGEHCAIGVYNREKNEVLKMMKYNDTSYFVNDNNDVYTCKDDEFVIYGTYNPKTGQVRSKSQVRKSKA